MKNKKIRYKFVTIKQTEVAKKVETKNPNMFQRAFCWLVRVVPAKQYQYMFRIQYAGMGRLKKNDVVMNTQGFQFIVADEKNRYAMILSMPNLTEKPYIYEKLYILPKPKNKTL